MNNFDFLSVGGTAINVVSFANSIWSRHRTILLLSLKREIEGMVLQDQTTAAKETTVNNRDSRSHNICVS